MSSILEPALNSVTAPLLYMINNDFFSEVNLKDKKEKTPEEWLKEFNRPKLKKMSDNIDYFRARDIIPMPRECTETIEEFVEDHGKTGAIYSIPIEEYYSFTKSGAEQYNHMLFLDITRDGMRLVVPIYKLFNFKEEYGKDEELEFFVFSSNVPMGLDLQEDDRFLVSPGDNLRTVFRHLKKQHKFKSNVSLEHAGVRDFSIDSI